MGFVCCAFEQQTFMGDTMLNMDRANLIASIEGIKSDTTERIEWNLEFLFADYCANRGHPHYGLATAYDLLATGELKSRKKKGKK